MTSSAPHQALYRRWRAQTFAEIVGQEAVVETLRNAVRQERVAHAILFVGPRGTGKTSLARILAKALNCTDLRDGDPCDRCPSCVSIREGRALDLVEIDAASNRGIDAIRELRERIHYAPTDLRRKVYILDEAHQITKDAWNALLKSLEEPPEFVVFMFASTHPQEFPPAILSRLQRFDVRRLSVPEIEGKLSRILAADDRVAEPGAVRLIARLAAGGMRDAESMLDQLLSSASGAIDELTVRDLLGLADAEAVDSFVDALVRGDPVAGLELLDRLEERGRDVRVLLEQVVEAIRGRIVERLGTDTSGTSDLWALAAAARRLGAIDPTRASIGGLRLQLELALFPESPGASTGRAAVPAVFPAPARTTPAKAVVSAAPPPAPVRERVARSTVAEPAVAFASDARTAAEVAPAPPALPITADVVPAATDAAPGGVDAAADVAPAAADVAPAAAASASPAASVSAAAPAPDTTPAPAADAARTPPTAAGGDLETLRSRWPEVVARISQHPPTKPLIAACRPISVEGNVVTLGFPEDQAFLRDVAERRRQILEQGVGEFLGRSVAVRCVATNLDLVPAPAAGDDSAALLAEARRIFAEELVDVGEVS